MEGRTLPPRQLFVGESVLRTGADKVQLQRIDQALTYLEGLDWRKALIRRVDVPRRVHDFASLASRSGLQICAASRQ